MSQEFVTAVKTLFPEKENAIEMKGTLAFLFLYYVLIRSQKNGIGFAFVAFI
jgi:hypothetical protein